MDNLTTRARLQEYPIFKQLDFNRNYTKIKHDFLMTKAFNDMTIVLRVRSMLLLDCFYHGYDTSGKLNSSNRKQINTGTTTGKHSGFKSDHYDYYGKIVARHAVVSRC